MSASTAAASLRRPVDLARRARLPKRLCRGERRTAAGSSASSWADRTVGVVIARRDTAIVRSIERCGVRRPRRRQRNAPASSTRGRHPYRMRPSVVTATSSIAQYARLRSSSAATARALARQGAVPDTRGASSMKATLVSARPWRAVATARARSDARRRRAARVADACADRRRRSRHLRPAVSGALRGCAVMREIESRGVAIVRGGGKAAGRSTLIAAAGMPCSRESSRA